MFAAAIAAYAFIAWEVPDTATARLVRGIIYTAVALSALIALVRASRSARGAERQLWLLLTATVSLQFAGDLLWIVREVVDGAMAAYQPAMSQLLYSLGFAPLVLYTFNVLASGLTGAPILTKVRYVLDLLIAILIVDSVVVLALLLPSYRTLAVEDVAAWTMYSILFLATTSVFVALVASVLESRRSVSYLRWEIKVVAAVGFPVAAGLIILTSQLYSLSAAAPRMVVFVDLLWMAAYFILMTAALQRLDGGTDATSLPPTAHARRMALRWYDLGTAGILLVAVPYTLYEARYGNLGEPEFWLIAAASFGVAILVITRSIILTSENGSLLFHTVVDPLTGSFNHRYFQERVLVEVERARRVGGSVSLVLMDIDGFSLINDRRGHSGGDQCLMRMAEILRLHERSADTVCRMGGDEFAMIMVDTDAEAASARARAIQEAIATDPLAGDCIESISVGIASMPEHAGDRTALVAKADGALYWAQAIGSGHVIAYDEQVVEALGPKERLQIAEEQSYMQTVESLASAVDARDPYTQFHSRNVSLLAGRLALKIGLAEHHARLVEIAGLLHDVGKIGVPDSILRKAGPLDSEERRQIEEHPDLGQRILSATIFKEILPWVLSHHECWDGSGYPHGLAADEIPLEARILAVCDSFDAMVSDRPYRKGTPVDVAVHEMEVNSGTQFDPYLAELFIEMVYSDPALCSSYPASQRLVSIRS